MADTNPLFETDFGKSLLSTEQPKPQQQGASGNPLLQTEFMTGKKPEQETQAKPEGDMPWSSVASEAVQNLPHSAYQTFVEPVVNYEQTLQGLKQVGKGLYSKAAGVFTDQDPEQKAKDEAAINALGQHYANTYGSMEGFKKEFAQNPLSILSDASMFLTGGGSLAGKLPGIAGEAGNLIAKAGTTIDPLSLTAEAVKGAAKVAQQPINAGLWLRTGTSFNSLDEAAKAGFANNKTFLQGLNGTKTGEDAVNRVKGQLSDLIQEKNAAYSQGAEARRLNNANMEFDPVIQSWKAEDPRFTGEGYALPKNTTAEQAWRDAGDVINKYMQASKNELEADIPRNTVKTVYGFDQMKQALWNVQKSYQMDKEAADTVSRIRKSVYDQIASIDPRYARDMEAYQDAQSTVNQLQKEFSLGRNAAVGTTLKKLLKAHATDKTSDLFQELTKRDPDLVPLLAGIEMSETMPQGLRGQLNQALNYGAAAGYGLAHPAFLGNLALSSPRVAGMMNYGAGYVAGAPSRAVQSIPYLARQVPYGASRIDEANRQGRKSGGRVSHETIADQLIAAAESAKKMHGQRTEVLLDQPDEAITKALAVAKQNI